MKAVALRTNKATVAKRLLIVWIVIASITFLLLKDGSNTASIVILAIVAVIGLAASWSLIQLLLSFHAIVITDEGIQDRTYGLGFIPWAVVKSVKLRNAVGNQVVDLTLNEPERLLQHLSPIRRAMVRYGLSRGMNPYLNADFVEGRANEILHIIENHLARRSGA